MAKKIGDTDKKLSDVCTLDSGVNVGVRLLSFEKFWRKKKLKNDGNA